MKVGGEWVSTTQPWVRTGGEWKTVKAAWAKTGGQWRQWWPPVSWEWIWRGAPTLSGFTIPRHEFGGAMMGDYLYFTGGATENGLAVTDFPTVFRIKDLTTTPVVESLGNLFADGTVQRGAYRMYHSMNQRDGYLYVAGGHTGNGAYVQCNLLWRFNLSTNRWTVLGNLPRTHAGGAAEWLGDRMYLIGGLTGDWPSNPRSTVYSCDSTCTTWQAEQSMPWPVSTFASAVFNDRIWVMGGLVSATPAYVGTNRCYSFDGSTWQRESDLPDVNITGRAAVLEGRLYMGEGSNGSDTNVWWSTDGTDGWRSEPIFPAAPNVEGGACTRMRGYVGATSDSLAFFGGTGGTSGPPDYYTNRSDVFTATPETV